MLRFKITKNDAGLKAVRFLAKATAAPSSLIYKTFRKKDVKINGKWIKEDYVLREGEELTAYISGEFANRAEKIDPGLMPDVVYEDENLVVMNKPAGLKSQPDKAGEDALSSRLKAYLAARGEYDPAAESAFAPAICNRLDRNTDGLVIGAKNAAALREMNLAIRERRVRKLYRCITEGVPNEKTATLTSTIQKDEKTNKSTVGQGGKAVSLTYRVTDVQGNRARLEVELHTGRSHQIRAQLAAIGCPIEGDAKYGARTGGGQRLTAFRLEFHITEGILSYLNGKTVEI